MGVTRFFVRMGGDVVCRALDSSDSLRDIHDKHFDSFIRLLIEERTKKEV
ncbi:hypothetical protein P4G69_01265 [Bacillus cereus]|nr:hypothetical protein [Bacillus cereus]MEB8723626.1 hypothetical protein [Bacillus cereus]